MGIFLVPKTRFLFVPTNCKMHSLNSPAKNNHSNAHKMGICIQNTYDLKRIIGLRIEIVIVTQLT